MIPIHFQNLARVGFIHGLSENRLKAFCAKRQPLVEKVFQSKSLYGYAFLSLPDDKMTLNKIKKYVNEQKKSGWQNIVVLGIGGSALGTLAIREALAGEFFKGPKLHVIDNIDPAILTDFLSNINFKKSLFVVISKSGTTTETMLQYALVKNILMKKFPQDYQKHLVFVTDPKGGVLRKIAKQEKITAFDIPSKIGGRFSVLTSVGLLPCALAGLDVAGLLKGAAEMRDHLSKIKGHQNPALLLAAAQYLMDRKKGKVMTVLMPYSSRLFKLSDWYRQLLAESIGKNKNAGPTPINALGSTDQHSQLQLYTEGPNNKWFIFLRVLTHAADPKIGHPLPEEMGFLNGKKCSDVMQASYLGTSESLTQHKRPNLTIDVPAVDAKNLGALFMFFEFQLALLGLLYKVDAFNQPGVELSKQITKKILAGPAQ